MLGLTEVQFFTGGSYHRSDWWQGHASNLQGAGYAGLLGGNKLDFQVPLCHSERDMELISVRTQFQFNVV